MNMIDVTLYVLKNVLIYSLYKEISTFAKVEYV